MTSLILRDHSPHQTKIIWFLSLICLPLVLFNGCKPPSAPNSTSVRILNPTPVSFRDVTEKAGIAFNRFNGGYGARLMPEIMGGGGAFIDYDNDGWMDILLINGDRWPGHSSPLKRPTLALYHNDRNGRFTDV